MGGLDRLKGNLTEEECPPSANPLPVAIDVSTECWAKAELRTRELIYQIQPTVVSENQRKAVVQYVQRLVRRRIGCEVFAFGSVPLKTYLSDGDIDLTAFSKQKQLTKVWGNQVRSALEEEGRHKDAEFRVKDVQYIDAAEVKLVKCLVGNIVVDISYNQIGGLCTLCFLERVNRLIGKKNLFKRSIILVKAWCYYESRILGAHHALISTYALETLVLYIFHLFHASLRGPLEVLFRFLDYFSKFDWDNYCVSIQGPVPIASLPRIAAEPPQTDGGKLLLSKDFLENCLKMYSDVPNGHDSNSRPFSSKFLNVVDPLRENNNLGRSVSQANFYRIKSAFGYGARKLAKVLHSPEGKIAAELNCFFPITWERHANGQRPDVPDSISRGLECNFSVESESFLAFSESVVGNKQDTKEIASTEGNGAQYEDISVMAQSNGTDLNIVRSWSDDASLMNVGEMGSWEDGFGGKSISDSNSVKSERHDNLYNVVNDENVTLSDDGASFTSAMMAQVSIGAVVDGLSSPRSDLLSGDFKSHLSNLAYGRSCQNPVWHGSVAQSPVPPQHSQEHRLWEGPGRPVHPNMGTFSHIHGQGFFPRHPYFQFDYRGVNSPVLPGPFNVEEMRRPRSGTGTYLPNLSYHSYREKNFSKGKHQHGTTAHDSTAREGGAHHSSSRNQVGYNSGSSWQTGYSNIDGNFGNADLSRNEGLCKSSYPSGSHAVMGNIAVASQPGLVVPGLLHSLPHVSSQEAPSFTPVGPCGPPLGPFYHFSNGTTFASDPLEFGTFGPVQLDTGQVRSETGGHVISVLNEQSYMSGAAAPLPSSSERGLEQPSAPLKQERASPRSYQMKEEDFPPLPFQGKHKGNSATAGNGHSCNSRSSHS